MKAYLLQRYNIAEKHSQTLPPVQNSRHRATNPTLAGAHRTTAQPPTTTQPTNPPSYETADYHHNTTCKNPHKQEPKQHQLQPMPQPDPFTIYTSTSTGTNSATAAATTTTTTATTVTGTGTGLLLLAPYTGTGMSAHRRPPLTLPVARLATRVASRHTS
jgi:hypothetical protein